MYTESFSLQDMTCTAGKLQFSMCKVYLEPLLRVTANSQNFHQDLWQQNNTVLETAVISETSFFYPTVNAN